MKRVLVIDDDPFVLELLEGVLTEAGYVVRTCDDATELLGLVETFEPSVVILDVGMAGVDGREAALSLVKRGRPVPILFYSARPTAELHAICHEIPRTSFITKGTPMSTLVDSVRRIARASGVFKAPDA
ncbi:MAG: response regulator [Myxococcota bacterium]